jgi:tetratricopeptide (TPR) repeat protein
MRKAGLRDVQAFTIYQKALDVYNRAHGEIETIPGLRQANLYFDQVIELVPDFSQVYVDHSDLFIHLLSDDAADVFSGSAAAEEIVNALPAAIADYQAAERHAQSANLRRMMELDQAFISGNWRGMGGRIELALDEPGCFEGNWTPIIADAFGYSEKFLERSYEILKCDPRRSISWFNTARSAMRTGDKEEALRIAREGSEIAPGTWLSTSLIRALVAHSLHEEANKEIDNRIQDVLVAIPMKMMVAAHEGDQSRFNALMEEYDTGESERVFWLAMSYAWGGNREAANRQAAMIDQHFFGLVPLAQVTAWCGCGAPWDLEVTPNFAAKLEESGLAWPPEPIMDFPLKDW